MKIKKALTEANAKKAQTPIVAKQNYKNSTNDMYAYTLRTKFAFFIKFNREAYYKKVEYPLGAKIELY